MSLIATDISPQDLAQLIYNLRIQIENTNLLLRQANDRLNIIMETTTPSVLVPAIAIANQLIAQHDA
jgi:hypothetical protein